ncbi:LysR family transcriptional regulator [Enterobacter sp. Ap-916]|uniref:LysR family transcriptional regulator n=1 Tax=unclassified Enterobacter TaxID=2608935 RepID=UPI0014246C2D|nr:MULTISPECIES: LysR substrate-binding domain-containing protein [unclassified Enterobacter]NIF59820.1 LysR family transcriptional regulator [Enterobacter sp. Ap-867]NIG31208.1 LysR family transcriptional regulator [Enterobacter sp. Ap-916]
MELRHLRYFLEVARTLHFGAAAETLNISTPTLSVQISQLEREFGTPLFLRTKRRVQLTQAGEIFREEAEATLRQAELTRERVLSAARGEQGYIRVGYVASSLWSGTLSSVMGAFRGRYPDISLGAREVLMDSMAAALVEGKIDVGFVRAPVALPSEVGHLLVQSDCFCLALPACHRLASGTEAIDPAALAGESFILPEQTSGSHEVARRGGFVLNDAIRSSTLTEVLAHIALGNGIAVIPEIMAKTIGVPDVVYRPIAGAEIPSAIWMLYRKRERTPMIKRLIRFAKEHVSGGSGNV